MAKLRDAVVVITGGSSGIGRATALEFARHGAVVVVASRADEPLEEVAALCRDLSGNALAVTTDVTRDADVQALVDRVLAEYGRIDVWVNNAAVGLAGRFEETPPDAWERVIDVNLFGYVRGARSVLPVFREQGGGQIINVASILGRAGAPMMSAYVTSKFAILGFTESLRMELRNDGIEICAILPASIDTPIYQHAGNFSGRKKIAVQPVTAPEDVARAIVRLARRPRAEVTVGRGGWALMAMRHLLGGFGERLIARGIERRHFRDWPVTPHTGNLFSPAGRESTTGGWGNAAEERGTRWAAVAIGGGAVAAAAATAAAVGYRAMQPKRRAPWKHLPLIGGRR